LIALLGVKVSAYENLVRLQSSYVEDFESDAASRDDLKLFTEMYKTYNAHFTKQEESASSSDSSLLDSQLGDVTKSITEALKTFSDFKQAQIERLDVFKNYLSDTEQENLDVFKN